LAEPEIDQRCNNNEQSIEPDQAIALCSEQTVIGNVKNQRKNQACAEPDKIRQHVQQLTLAHRSLVAKRNGRDSNCVAPTF
jgi:hypothetical protein